MVGETYTIEFFGGCVSDGVTGLIVHTDPTKSVGDNNLPGTNPYFCMCDTYTCVCVYIIKVFFMAVLCKPPTSTCNLLF